MSASQEDTSEGVSTRSKTKNKTSDATSQAAEGATGGATNYELDSTAVEQSPDERGATPKNGTPLTVPDLSTVLTKHLPRYDSGSPIFPPNRRGATATRTSPSAPPQLATLSGRHQTDNSNTRSTPIISIVPNLDTIEPFKEGGDFEDYLERWEILMAQYNYSNEQLALALPAKLVGAAWETYKNIIKLNPRWTKDYSKMKQELLAAFRTDNPLQEKNLWSISQGRKSVNDFYADIIAAGRSVFKGMPEVNRDQVIKAAFIGGLKESYQRSILKQGDITLQQALKEARNLEAIDRAVVKNRVTQVDHVDQVDADLLTPLTKQIQGLTNLVDEQTRRMKINENQSTKTQKQKNYQLTDSRDFQTRGRNDYRGSQGHNYRQRYSDNFNRGYDRRGKWNNRPWQGTNSGQRRNQTSNGYTRSPFGGNYRKNYEDSPQPDWSQTQRNRTTENFREQGSYASRHKNEDVHACESCTQADSVAEVCDGITQAEIDQMGPSEFARFYLAQTGPKDNYIRPRNAKKDREYTEESINCVTFAPTPPKARRTFKGGRFGLFNIISYMQFCLFCLCITGTSGYNWQPNNPMICGSGEDDSPQLFKI